MNDRDVSIQDTPRVTVEGGTQTIARPWLWVGALVLYGLGIGLPSLGSAPLMSHEVLVAERTRGLTTEGAWVIPYVNGQADLRKPPLPFWIAGALSALTGGVSEWTVRLPSVAAMLGTMLLLIVLVRRMVGWRTALVTGFVFATSVAAMTYGRRAEVDMQLCFWTTLALAAWWLGSREPTRRRQIAWFVMMWIALALGVLTKGPLPVAIVAVTVTGVAVFGRGGLRVGRMLPILGPLLLLALLLPWGVLVLLRHPAALSSWYMESVGRYAGQFGHEQPWHYYILHAPILWLPWILPVGIGFYLAVRRAAIFRADRLFLLAWGIGGLVFLSLSTGKRLHYALPAIPPLLILAGLGLDHLVFGMPRPLSRLSRKILGLHWLMVPGVVVAAVFAAERYPSFEGAIFVATGAMSIGLTGVLMFYTSGRRVAALVTFAVLVLAVQAYAMSQIAAPYATWTNLEAATGRRVAEDAARGDVCIYPEPSSTVSFYAGATLPVFVRPEQIRTWRQEHPHGYVIVRPCERQDELRTLGPWEEIHLLSNRPDGRANDLVLLRASSSGGIGPAGLATTK